jgi:hypothetical protein
MVKKKEATIDTQKGSGKEQKEKCDKGKENKMRTMNKTKATIDRQRQHANTHRGIECQNIGEDKITRKKVKQRKKRVNKSKWRKRTAIRRTKLRHARIARGIHRSNLETIRNMPATGGQTEQKCGQIKSPR